MPRSLRWLLIVVSMLLWPGHSLPWWEVRFRSIPAAWGPYEHLAYYTSQPHIAGTPEDYATAVYTADKLRQYGFDAELWPTEVLMSYPQYASLKLLGPKPYTAWLREAVLPEDPTSGDPRSYTELPYNCYSASGTVRGKLVYANYGQLKDFQYLDNHNISVKGRIVIVRYGKVFRGLKVWQAQVRGAAGVIIYSDPEDDGFKKGPTYPNGPWRPPFSVQRGSAMFSSKCEGSPDSRRFDVCGVKDQSELIPAIPVQPIGYGDAEHFLRALQGVPAPQDWQGGLDFPYQIGPGPATVELVVQHDMKMRTIWNVIGTLKGTAEPDRWVILGNHRDAWTFGAADPNSGTATILEVARGLGELMKEGWRPRRTIVITSWDGEEPGLLGSTAWVEANEAELAEKVVAYLNVDVAVSGPNWFVHAVPTLNDIIREAAHNTHLRGGAPVMDIDGEVTALGGGSDYEAFLNHIGITCLDMGFSQTTAGDYATYHSNYDSIAWMNRFGDPTYEHYVALAQIWGVIAIRLADSPVIPFNYSAYAAALYTYTAHVNELIQAREWTLSLKPLIDAIDQLAASAADIGRQAAELRMPNPSGHAAAEMKLRDLNDRLIRAERHFLHPGGLPERKWYRHLVYAQGLYLGYGADVFPGLAEAVRSQTLAIAETQLKALVSAIQDVAQVLSRGVTK